MARMLVKYYCVTFITFYVTCSHHVFYVNYYWTTETIVLADKNPQKSIALLIS